MVANERWSLTRGGRKGRFDCILLTVFHIFLMLLVGRFLSKNQGVSKNRKRSKLNISKRGVTSRRVFRFAVGTVQFKNILTHSPGMYALLTVASPILLFI